MTEKRVELVTFACPNCGKRLKALPSATVDHRCPNNRNRFVIFKPEEAETE